MSRLSILLLASIFALTAFVSPATAQNAFSVTSPALIDGGPLSADLKCTRDGGDGLSPPIGWAHAPEGTSGYAVIMHHFPKGHLEGKDTPSQYWLLWNIPADTTHINRGNPTSIGDEGADKDARRTGYTAPCSPPNQPVRHSYTITVYAVSAPLETLPDHDDQNVDWTHMTAAMEGLVLGSASLTFTN